MDNNFLHLNNNTKAFLTDLSAAISLSIVSYSLLYTLTEKTDMPKRNGDKQIFGTELPNIQALMAGVKGSYLGISVPFTF